MLLENQSTRFMSRRFDPNSEKVHYLNQNNSEKTPAHLILPTIPLTTTKINFIIYIDLKDHIQYHQRKAQNQNTRKKFIK